MSAPTLDQLRVFITVVDSGSFSAASRRLGRTQPVISYNIANLESLLGLTLFERGRRRPVLTDNGAALLTYARRMCLLSDELRAEIDSLSRGLEGELGLVVDVLYPKPQLASVLQRFAEVFPAVALRVESACLGEVLSRVRSRGCVLGISGLFMDWPDDIEARDFGRLEMLPVAAAEHLLAVASRISMSMLREHLQLILRDASGLTAGGALAISGVRTWEVSDFDTKRALLLAGVGWGHMPRHLVETDVLAGRLRALNLPIRREGRQAFTLIQRSDSPPGPAGRWLAAQLLDSAAGK